jgi:hypothetical protein
MGVEDPRQPAGTAAGQRGGPRQAFGARLAVFVAAWAACGLAPNLARTGRGAAGTGSAGCVDAGIACFDARGVSGPGETFTGDRGVGHGRRGGLGGRAGGGRCRKPSELATLALAVVSARPSPGPRPPARSSRTAPPGPGRLGSALAIPPLTALLLDSVPAERAGTARASSTPAAIADLCEATPCEPTSRALSSRPGRQARRGQRETGRRGLASGR